jgi:Predicted membrane protein (DUF2306)
MSAMLHSMTSTRSQIRQLTSPRTARWAKLSISGLTLVLCAVVGVIALGSGSGFIALPFEMAVLRDRVPVLFSLHMLASALALLLVPFVIGFRHRADVHRKLGRVLGFFVVTGALTALPVAIMSHSSLAARAGFFTQGVVWLALLTAGLMAARVRNYVRHARCMIAMAAVTTGAVWFRLITGIALATGLPFTPMYALASWIGWIIPLALVASRPDLAASLLARTRAAA